MTEAEFRALRKQYGICRDCGKEDAYTMRGRTYCYECAEKARAAKEKARQNPEKKEKMLRQKREQIERYRKEHKCLGCGKKLDTEKRLCNICLFKQREALRRSRAKRCVTPNLRGENNICWQCNKKPCIEGKKLCQECYDKKLPIAMANLEKTRTANHVWRKSIICRK